jgi:CcmD family protein
MIRIAWAVLLMLLCAGPASLAAQDTQPPPGFETMKVGDPSSTESLPAAPLVYGAYAAVWLVLLAYLYVLWRRASRVDAALRELQSRVTTTRR